MNSLQRSIARKRAIEACAREDFNMRRRKHVYGDSWASATQEQKDAAIWLMTDKVEKYEAALAEETAAIEKAKT